MKILHVTRQFYPTTGGIPNAIWHLSKYLISKGHESHVIALNRLFQEERSYLNPHEVIEALILVFRHVRQTLNIGAILVQFSFYILKANLSYVKRESKPVKVIYRTRHSRLVP